MSPGKLRARDSQGTVQPIFDNGPQIEYSNGWVLNNLLNTNKNPPQNETSHSTGQVGSTMFISFNGNQVNVSGTIPAGDAPIVANYIFDDFRRFTQSVPAATQDVLHQTLFSSPVLEDGCHNLTVQVVQTGLGRNYTFQQFNVSTPSSGGACAGVSSSVPDSMDSQTQGDNEPRRGVSAAVVGGILTAIIVALLIVILSLCFWRKDRASVTRKAAEQHLQPPVYFGRPASDGFEKEYGVYPHDSASVIDTNSKFTFVVHEDARTQSHQSWVTVDRPPTVPRSALISPRTVPEWSTYRGASEVNEETRTFRTVDREISDWSSYKGSSVILPQRPPDRSYFSPYTTTTLSPVPSRVPVPRVAPSNKLSSPTDDTRSSLSSLPPPFERRMF